MKSLVQQTTSTRYKPFKIIVFDLDGTLIDTSEVVVYAFRKVFEDAFRLGEVDRIPSHELILSTFGMLDCEIWDLLAPSMPEKSKSYYRQIHDKLIRERLLKQSCILPGVLELLKRLHTNYILATASNCGLTYLETVLSTTCIHSYITYPLCAESVDASEKADILRELIRQVGHKQMLMVGDRSTDVEAAMSVGIPVAGVSSKFGNPHELVQANIMLDTVLDLEKYL